MLRLGIDPEKPHRATFIYQDGLCCCNMALISFRLFRKNLGNLQDFFGQIVYPPPPPGLTSSPVRSSANAIQSPRPTLTHWITRPRTARSNWEVNARPWHHCANIRYYLHPLWTKKRGLRRFDTEIFQFIARHNELSLLSSAASLAKILIL